MNCLQECTDVVKETMEKMGLKYNVNNCKMSSSLTKSLRFVINGKEIEQVNHFRYLGTTICHDETSRKELHFRVGKANADFESM